MNKFKTLVATAVMGFGLVAPAAATQMYMDVSQFGIIDFNGDGASTTAKFDNFITTAFTPTSIYLDSNGVAGIQTGDFVTDVVNNLKISSLQPTDGVASEGYNTTWELSVNWTLSGIAALIPDALPGFDDNYVGLFNMGTITVDLTRKAFSFMGMALQTAQTFTNVLTLDLIGSFGTVPTGNAQAITLTTKVAAVQSGVFFNESGLDFATLLTNGVEVQLVANSDLSDLNQAPVFTGVQQNGFDVYERSTQLGSVDIRNVPAPASIAIFGLALMGLGAARRIKK